MWYHKFDMYIQQLGFSPTKEERKCYIFGKDQDHMDYISSAKTDLQIRKFEDRKVEIKNRRVEKQL